MREDAGEDGIPNTIADLDITIDLKARQNVVSTIFDAPTDKGGKGRIGWLVRQLTEAPDQLVIEAYAKNARTGVAATLEDVREDPTVLFTGSGMQPLLPYLLGEPHPKGTRLGDSQTSLRAQDIEDVGDNRHTTFFEMLGNWSLGDYFKQEQIPRFFNFLVDEVGLDPNKIYATCFIGDEKNNLPKDEEAADIWMKIFKERGIDAVAQDMGSQEDGAQKGMGDARIFFYDAGENWWSRAGEPDNMPAGEPGGPDSEVFYVFEHDSRSLQFKIGKD